MGINQISFRYLNQCIVLLAVTLGVNLNLHGQTNISGANPEVIKLFGSPEIEGHFVYRVKLPSGFSSERQVHSGDYHVTVLKGNLYVSFNSRRDTSDRQLFKTGTYFIIPARQTYYQWVKEETLLQVNGVGPSKTLTNDSLEASGESLKNIAAISIDSSMVSPKMIRMHGDMTKEGPYSVRVKFTAGTILNPHRHNNDHYVTVLKGKLIIGYGEKFDFVKSDTIQTGQLLRIEANKIHFEQFPEETIVQIHGPGPLKTEMIKSVPDGKR